MGLTFTCISGVFAILIFPVLAGLPGYFPPSKLRVAGSNPAGVANKINKLFDFRDRISTQRTAKGAAGVEIRPIHSLLRACACLSGAQPINRGL